MDQFVVFNYGRSQHNHHDDDIDWLFDCFQVEKKLKLNLMTNIIYINDKLWNKFFMNHHHQHHHHNNERQNKTSFFHIQIKTIGIKISYWTPADHCGWWWWWSPVIKWWGIIIDQSLRCLWRRAKKIFSIFFQFYNNPDFFSFTSYWMRFKMYSNWMCKIEKFLVDYKLSLIFYKFYVLIYNLDEIIVQHIQTNKHRQN